MDSKGKGGWQRSRILTPADLQATIVQREALVRSNLEECEGSCGVNKSHELKSPSQLNFGKAATARRTHSNVLVLHVSNALQDTSTNGITQILSRRLRMDVPEVHCPVQALRTCHTLHSIARERRVGCEWGASIWARLSSWGEGRRLCNE